MKVKFGLSNVHIAFFSDTATAEDPDYDTPIRLPGAVNLTAESDSQEEPFYADNIKYYTSFNSTGGTGELEVALVPDEIAIKMFGYIQDENGALVEVANAKPKSFALLHQIETDVNARKIVLYNVSAGSPSDEASTTEGGKTPKTTTIPISFAPIILGDKQVLKMSIDDATKEVYQNFYEEVQLPSFETTTP